MTRASDKPSGALTPSRALRAAEILEQALDAPPSRQLDVVRAASGGDEAMEREVLSLLGAHAKAGAFLQPPLRGATMEPGTLLGTYRVIERIGAGGMGEVYRARDEVLGRSVAIKVLSDERARDASHVARLEREARSLAALNHPNIAAIYAVQSARDGHGPALVLELAAGKTLAQVLERGPLAVDEAVAIATQVARALEAAHGAGIVHRDLKPANIAIAEDGTVKVLDFGLAKSTHEVEVASGSGAGLSPVVTQVGMLVGTIAYMSPEQARGKAIDRRADMWAFGCVLYEMLVGKRLFKGEDAGEVFQRVIAGEVEVVGLPTSTPLRVRRVIERCLRKDLDKRMRDAGDARVELEEAVTDTDSLHQRTSSVARWWLVAAACVVAAVGGAGAFALLRGGSAPVVAINEQYSVLLPEKTPIIHHYGPPVSLRTGTRELYFTSWSDEGGYTLVRRNAIDASLSSEGFENGDAYGILSVDDRRMAYWRTKNGKTAIAVRDMVSGTDIAEHDFVNAWHGIAWLDDQTLAIAQSAVADRLVLWNWVTNRVWVPNNLGSRSFVQPSSAVDGRTLLVSLHETIGSRTTRDIFAWREELSAPVKLLENAQMPIMMGKDVMLFYRGDGIWAVKIDVAAMRTVGPEVSVINGLARDTDEVTFGMYNVGAAGELLYLPTSQTYEGAKLVWADESGKTTDVVEVESRLWAQRISPDASKIAYIAGGAAPDLFVHDFERGTDWLAAPGHAVLPVWTRDSASIVYQYVSPDGNQQELRRVVMDGSALPTTVVRLEPNGWAQPTDVTLDNKYVLAAKHVGPKDETDIYRVTLDGSGVWEPVFATHADRTNARLSSDGTLIAYTSDESGDLAVYVQPYPSLDKKMRVSLMPAFRLSWARDSNTLFFRGAGDVYSVDVALKDSLEVSPPKLRFTGLPESRFDVSPDGSRIVQAVSVKSSALLREVRVWLGAETVIRQRLDAAAKAAKR